MQVSPPYVKATAAAPTHAEGELTTLSVTLAGSLRTAAGAGTSDMNLLQVGSTAITLGQKAMAASLPVVIASDQSAVAISAASLPLPTGASTAANQLAAGHNVTVIAPLPSLVAGSANIGDVDVLTQPARSHTTDSIRIGDGTDLALVTAAGALVVDGSGVTQPISAVSLPLPTGAATSASQLPDSHNVTVDNAGVGAAVNVQDGGNSLTVDGTVTANPATSFGKTITYVPVAQGGAGTTVLAAASGGNKHKVIGAFLTMTLAGTLKFNDGVTDLTGPLPVVISGGFVLPGSLIPYTETATGNALNLITTLGAAQGVVAILTEA